MPKNRTTLIFLAVLVALAAFAGDRAFAGLILHVDSSIPTSGNGTTWALSMKDLQIAINRATTQPAGTYDEIRVAKGRYVPTTQATDRAATFRLVRGVKIKGGYPGYDAADPDAEDPQLNATVLSGDLRGDDPLMDDNSFTVVTAAPVSGTPLDATASMEGFSITGGNGGGGTSFCPGTPDGIGAGVYCPANQSPTIRNCRITRNQVNVSCDPPAQNAGGGMYVGANAAPQVINCVFEENEAGRGGGLHVFRPAFALVISQCQFIKNYATESGGGGVFVDTREASNRVRLLNCVFRENEAQKDSGGGLFAVTPTDAPLELFNNLFDRNLAIINGGAIYAESSSVVKVTNCTLASNQAILGAGGGVFLNFSSTATVVNSVLWGNKSPSNIEFLRQIDTGSGSSHATTYSDIQGCSSCGTGNISTDPQFLDPSHANYRLQSGSQCLNAGNNSALAGTGVTLDLDQHARILPTTGGTIDMGAYERPTVLNSDCNNNGIDDTCETSCAGDCTGVAGCGTAEDCNQNQVPDACDIAADIGLDCDGDGVMNGCESPQFVDCNHNCVADADDISGGSSTDCNANTKPDDCEFTPPLVCTDNAEFDKGYSINVNHSTDHQLQRNPANETRPAPYVWMPFVKLGETVARINAAATQPSGAILGEYHTAPRLHIDLSGPSFVHVNADTGRLAVDLDGSIWVGNESDEINNRGTVTKIGLVAGGTRVNQHGAVDPSGQYLRGPFTYCTCEDRDGDGLIKTSRGQGDVLPWDNTDGRDDAANGPVVNAEDECIIRYVSTAARGIRLVAIDKNNNVWVGGTGNQTHQRVDGFSGAVDVASEIGFGAGGFNGLLDCQAPQVLWSATNEGSLVRYPIGGTADYITPSGGSFDLNIDLSGNLWMTNNNTPGTIQRVSPAGLPGTAQSTTGDGRPQGVAITPIDGNIWVANSGTTETGKNVTRLGPTGSFRKEISLGTTAQKPTGIAVDAFGKLWVSCFESRSIKRIDPNGDPSDHLGAVDLEITPNVNPGPEAFGDLTGIIGLRTSGTGTWSIVHDGVQNGVEWGCIRWNTEACVTPQIPAGTSLIVEARAANRRLALPAEQFTGVSSGSTLSGIVGRFVEVRVRFSGSCPEASFATPVLCDLQIRPAVSCVKGNCNHDTSNQINGADIAPFVRALLGAATCLFDVCPADMDNSGTVTSADIPCFLNKLLNPSGVDSCSGYNACGELEVPSPRSGDCNTNGAPDDNDIAAGTSQDCNNNFIPDECDIAGGDPDGDGHVSADVDANGIPDECQPDCNHNSVPDVKDIAVATSADVNSNGVPDECEKDCNGNNVPDSWDISQHTSPDCNANDIPDSCDPDCNDNGVPDDCDIDPTDPDGDTIVYPDCNNSTLPDECDFDLPFIPSYDCNENGIPDECDIASAFSADTNENGIPDECEEEYMMGRAGGGEGESEFDAEAAWFAFYEWQFSEYDSLRAMSPVDRFEATLDKLYELGLPEAIPWAHVATP